MTPQSSDYASLKLATDPVPPRERVAVAREIFGREILNLELDADPNAVLRVDFTMRALTGLKFVTGFASGVVSRRTRQLLADSNDDLFLSLNETDRFIISQRGKEVTLGVGDAVLVSCAEPGAFRRSTGRAIGLRVPRAVFAHIAPTVEDMVGLLIPHHSEPLRLLRAYVKILDHDEALPTPELRHLAVSHVHDLLMLAINGSGDRGRLAAERGLKAARLHAIKSHIAQHLPASDLSITAVATAHQLTERYVQRLFEADGTTFSIFVRNQRLARAYRLLNDPRQAGRAISAIAYECGFGDISHFNRMFRRLYGMSPSEMLRSDRG
jgi:AraC-like DNA-binding protein